EDAVPAQRLDLQAFFRRFLRGQERGDDALLDALVRKREPNEHDEREQVEQWVQNPRQDAPEPRVHCCPSFSLLPSAPSLPASLAGAFLGAAFSSNALTIISTSYSSGLPLRERILSREIDTA